jgi:hypothetical protein
VGIRAQFLSRIRTDTPVAFQETLSLKHIIVAATALDSSCPRRFARASSRIAGGVTLVVSALLAGCSAGAQTVSPGASDSSPAADASPPVDSSPAADTSPSSNLDIPCDPKRVLVAVCQQCHSNPPRNSAPFPLVTYADTQVISTGEPLWHYMRIVVENGVMPLPPVTISAADRDTLTAWLEAGAPARGPTDSCDDGDTGEAGTEAADPTGDEVSDDPGDASLGADAPDGGNGTVADDGASEADTVQTSSSDANVADPLLDASSE